jgi:MoaA/NifB/PqqE/SkfB family radical SAM enzyme
MNPKTFCSAPWFELRIDWNGQFRPCCEMQIQKSDFKEKKQYNLNNTTVDQWMSSEYSQYLRQNLTHGIKLAECSTCWQKEQHGIYSLRQRSNDTVTNNQGNTIEHTWVSSFIKKHPTAQGYRIISADVKLSNVCNFSCAMCGPHDSSKIYDQWHKEPNNKFVQKQLAVDSDYFNTIKQNYQTQRGYQHLLDLLKQPLTHLKLLGGEPLLDKMLFEILSSQPVEKKSKIHLHFITNGSLSLVNAAEQLKDYKSISFSVSLEGIGSMQDYARAGSNWATVEKNILSAKQHSIQLWVQHTLQAMTVLKLSALLDWCIKHDINISFGILNNPDYLSISILPEYIRKQVLKNLDYIKDINLLSVDNNEENNVLSVENIKNIINAQPNNSDKYPEFLEYVTWYERNSSIKLVDICPELSH